MEGLFLQSPEWEEIQRQQGRKTWRVEGALIIQHIVPFGFNYLYTPRPTLQKESEEKFFEKAETIAKKERSIFLKVDPLHVFQTLSKNGVASFSLQPHKTIVCFFSGQEDALLRQMHEKTRYNVRLAERKGIAVERKEATMLPEFFDLLKKTVTRYRFRAHEERYYENLLAQRSDNFSNELFFAEYQGKPIAGAIVNFYRSPISKECVATYLHGASSREYREMMGSHLLHWRIMQEAKKRGFRAYDFWGTDESRWPGVTRFKRSFGGSAVTYPESFDIIYRTFYYRLYAISRSLRSR